MPKYIAAIDQGTTSTRFMLFDHGGDLIASAQKEHRQLYPRPGWVEHDPLEIWARTQDVIAETLERSGISPKEIASVGVTNQRETTVAWDKATGQPVYNAIVWQDTRTDAICSALAREGGIDRLRSKTGLPLATYFSGPKLKWILDTVDGVRARATRGELLFGNIDAWIIWNLTGEHITDVTNASRTLLMNLVTLDWDDEVLDLMDIPRGMLPRICSSSEAYGAARGSLDGVPVAGDLGDQQAALFGQSCYAAGEAKNTYGTGCFLLQNIGTTPTRSKQQLVTTVAWQIGSRTEYALEGSVFVAGAAIQWLRDGLQILAVAAESERLAREVPDTGGVYFVPAFVGLGAPHWEAGARGTIVGLTRGTGRAHLVRAALEAMAFSTQEVLDAMTADAGLALTELQVDGGAAANDWLMQFQADLLGVRVARPDLVETTALGAAGLAGLATGVWGRAEDFLAGRRFDRFEPGAEAAADN